MMRDEQNRVGFDERVITEATTQDGSDQDEGQCLAPNRRS
jgi:hypothetical protein